LNNGGVVIDLSALAENSIVVDGDEVTVGAGVTWRDVYPALAPHGLVFPGGECPMVSVAGLTLGGGISLLSRSLGLTIDHLLEATVVTADGSIVKVSDTLNPDLFWALRGAGASYGVTTSMKFKLTPIEANLLAGEVEFDSKSWIDAILRVTDYMANQAPRELNLQIMMRSTGGQLRITYNGPVDEGREVVEALLAGTPKHKRSLQARPYANYLSTIFGELEGQFHGYWRSAFVDEPLSEDTLALVHEHVALAPSELEFASIEFFNGAVHDQAPPDTAFVHRDRLALVGAYGNWLGETGSGEPISWARGLYEAIEPTLSNSHYQNYPSLEVEDWADGYYGANYPRLRQIKSLVDPENLFGSLQSVRPR